MADCIGCLIELPGDCEPPPIDDCEQWTCYLPHLRTVVMQGAGCLHKHIKTDIENYDYTKGHKELLAFIEWIENCQSRRDRHRVNPCDRVYPIPCGRCY